MLSRAVFLRGRVPASKCRKFWVNKRTHSNLYPKLGEFTSKLRHPKFTVAPTDIRVLLKPTDFHEQLKEMINNAHHRIFISSLYLGSTESDLVQLLTSALQRRPNLRLDMLFDLNRSTRPEPNSTAKLIAPLVTQYPDRVNVAFFRSPSLRGLMAKLVPPRYNEGWGTWHAKIYGADNELMISGANLNKSYFTDRQDRYIHFSHQHQLAHYCFDFIKAVSNFSFKLLPATIRNSEEHSVHTKEYSLRWPLPNMHPHEIHGVAQAALASLQDSYRHITSEPLDPRKIALFPLMQAGQFNIREEEDTLQMLFEHLNDSPTTSRPLVDLTSGYFGLYDPYQKLILEKPNVDCRIVAASPRANGFYGSRGISGRIPEGYTLLEQRFMQAVLHANRQFGVQLNQWERDGWTYHAKGIWVSESEESLPLMTLFGSTNLNSRSAHIDTELSFLMLAPDDDSEAVLALRRQLAAERDNILAHSKPWSGHHRQVRLGTKALVWLVGGML
ncbi:CDP-diacylglycerol--glycerol-3-phosphate 3-phosphatidyltransferase [Mycena indigotica]|uniref:CDP-diacylglycerol--glycerol-3-phosphate 3-phosphatidyltransferase n=1 Tax=Mycena indigotica TaxID=2126181 RepID=A0A8H6WDP3_9AGAR|nr:CDP-diacylglycerol--glycerol-3-phosphate 3-phosphatidyltransferase [Mycena indigotica]KAF7312706.1 CDP-diacylglycerol--glycerol-3-phosphate 3-phosphatidyltransferase [Mycena indigotica]